MIIQILFELTAAEDNRAESKAEDAQLDPSVTQRSVEHELLAAPAEQFSLCLGLSLPDTLGRPSGRQEPARRMVRQRSSAAYSHEATYRRHGTGMLFKGFRDI